MAISLVVNPWIVAKSSFGSMAPGVEEDVRIRKNPVNGYINRHIELLCHKMLKNSTAMISSW